MAEIHITILDKHDAFNTNKINLKYKKFYEYSSYFTILISFKKLDFH